MKTSMVASSSFECILTSYQHLVPHSPYRDVLQYNYYLVDIPYSHIVSRICCPATYHWSAFEPFVSLSPIPHLCIL